MGHLVRTPAGTWRANWREPTGHQRAKTFRTKKEATAFLAQVQVDLRTGAYIDPAAGRVLFREYMTRWREARQMEITTAAATDSRLRNHLLPEWGDWPIGKIDHLDVQAWVTRLGKRLAPQTVASCHSKVI